MKLQPGGDHGKIGKSEARGGACDTMITGFASPSVIMLRLFKQDRVGRTYLRQKEWLCMSILNGARVGKFSSDRAIREYCEKIWRANPVEID